MQDARAGRRHAPFARIWSLRTSPSYAAAGRGEWVIGEPTGGRQKTTGKWSDDLGQDRPDDR